MLTYTYIYISYTFCNNNKTMIANRPALVIVIHDFNNLTFKFKCNKKTHDNLWTVN